jgi:cell wall assembly regulator SMI1
MIDSLERILDWLQQNSLSSAAEFLPGLSFKEIEERVSDLPFKLPKEVYALYQWRNGTNSEANIFVYHYFLDLDTALHL